MKEPTNSASSAKRTTKSVGALRESKVAAEAAEAADPGAGRRHAAANANAAAPAEGEEPPTS